jgi:hypothetical protein
MWEISGPGPGRTKAADGHRAGEGDGANEGDEANEREEASEGDEAGEGGEAAAQPRSGGGSTRGSEYVFSVD